MPEPHLLSQKKLNNDEVLELINTNEMLQLHKALEDCIGMMSNEKTMDLIVNGKTLVKAITGYMLQTLYGTPAMLEKVKSKFDKSVLNFKMVEIKSLEKGDIYDTLEKDYSGLIGIKYY